jgi:exopolysaccharide production protein ExoZ
VLTRIQILRAVAAYAVVLHHWTVAILYNTDFEVPGGPAGQAGVDLFFVISGFVMVHISGRRDGPGRFVFDRFARIAPLYWIATLVGTCLIMIRPWLFGLSPVTPEALVTSLLFIPSFNASGSILPIHFVGWTLNHEMMFYLLFALSMFAPQRWRVGVVLALISILFVASTLTPDQSAFSFYSDPIIFEFGAGCVIGALTGNTTVFTALARVRGWIYVVVGIVLFIANETFLSGMENRLVRWGVPATLVVIGVVVKDLTQPKAAKGYLAELGDASYSAYILHMFVINAAVLTILPFVRTSALGLALVFPVIAGITALVSAASHKAIEIPARNFLRRRFFSKRDRAVSGTT